MLAYFDIGQSVLYRGSEYVIVALSGGLVVVSREGDPIEVCIPFAAATRLLTPLVAA